MLKAYVNRLASAAKQPRGIALGCLLTIMSAAPPPTPAAGYHFGFRHGAVTGFAVACLTAAVALWLSPHLRRLRRQSRAPVNLEVASFCGADGGSARRRRGGLFDELALHGKNITPWSRGRHDGSPHLFATVPNGCICFPRPSASLRAHAGLSVLGSSLRDRRWTAAPRGVDPRNTR